jgi:hypothetical protein
MSFEQTVAEAEARLATDPIGRWSMRAHKGYDQFAARVANYFRQDRINSA